MMRKGIKKGIASLVQATCFLFLAFMLCSVYSGSDEGYLAVLLACVGGFFLRCAIHEFTEDS